MKGLVVLAVITLFLISFIAAINIVVTTGAINNGSSISAVNNENEAVRNPSSISAVVNKSEDKENELRNSTMAENYFCGKSTLGACQTDSDCITGGCSGQVCQSKNEESTVTNCIYRNCYNSAAFKINCLCINNKCMWSGLTEDQIKNITNAKNKINEVKNEECPESCTCTDSTIKCTLANGREMTIMAGNSGNIIIQVKGENMTTNVTLYKLDGKIYGVFKNNETKEVKMLPDQVKEKVRENSSKQFEDENISLDDNGIYQYHADKSARLFGIFHVKVPVIAQIDSQTGNILDMKNAWWAFLAKDDDNQVVGASCGTVTPGQNDACCVSKGFDFWNNETVQCEFNSSS